MKLKSFLVLLLIILEFNSDIQSSNSQKNHQLRKHKKKKFYVCPPSYIRLNHKCYLFNDKLQPWKKAYFDCQKSFGFLATIDSYTENRNLQTLLTRQRKINKIQNGYWVGGIYNWQLKRWKWADNNQELKFKGFQNTTKLKKRLDWHCILMGSKMWRPKLCMERHKSICETKIQRVNRKERKILLQKYQRRLNDISVIDLDIVKPRVSQNKSIDLQLSRKDNHFLQQPAIFHSTKNLRMQQKTLTFRNFHNDNSLHPNFIIEEHSFM